MIDGPDVDLLKNELKKLVVLPNGKVDHTNKSSKDLSDAVCGAVYNASVHTPRQDGDLEVMTYADIIKKNREVEAAKAAAKAELQSSNTPRVMPQEIADFLDAIRIF
jgi:hypothetical protein